MTAPVTTLVSCRNAGGIWPPGVPVESMLWPDQISNPCRDVVYGAHSEEEYLTLCRHALAEAAHLRRPCARRDRAEAASWPLALVPRW